MKAHDIFLEAVERPTSAERAAYLDKVCGDDLGLRGQIEGLVRSHEQGASFLEGSLFAPLSMLAPVGLLENSEIRVGPYKLLEPIGEGGMGVVYVAEQMHPVRRKVALKVIKPGMDTRQVIARFEAERQALAMMDHPNIAKVLDAGATDSGRPYFVMELVSGVPITDYCDRKRLSVSERLELFVLVCRAVQHAHQKSIIHRDIKPSNVLITLHDGVLVPKVIDFGIAKATGESLTDKTLLTGIVEMIGTPLYMSPEQANLSGIDIDTRSDIYSLGVLLYELLTGTTPFDQAAFRVAGFDEIRRIIREEEPPKPSTRLSTLSLEKQSSVSTDRKSDLRTLGKSVRGELDWIVMRALEKDRSRRYATANDFAADVNRYLTEQPVEACPPTSRYRFKKLVRRNRAVLTVGCLLSLTLLTGTAVSVWQAIRATQAERRSQRESLHLQILRILTDPHAYGWYDLAMKGVSDAARLGPDENRHLQGYAVVAQSGLDARPIKNIPIEATAMSFDPSGKNLYLCDTSGQAWVWDGSANPIRKLGTTGAGVFAFKPDGTAVQLLSDPKDKPTELQLRALEPETILRRFISPFGPDSRIQSIALTPTAAIVAATIMTKDHRGFAVVWNSETGDVLCQVEVDDPTCLCLSSDGGWLAVGTKNGEVAAWSLPKGEPLPRLIAGRVTITVLAFAQTRLSHMQPSKPTDGLLLAVGDIATGLSVFDLRTGSIRSRFQGSNNELHTLAFSPDATLLASAGRAEPRLWDVLTGRPLLQLDFHLKVTGVTFSPDGKRVAVSSAGVKVYELENGRGLQTLRGLNAEIAKLVISTDGHLVAALAQDFRVGIWDRKADKLIRVVEAPIGVYADNAGLAFSPDGQRFAFAAGTQAAIWDVKTGAVLESWKLPEGFQDNLAYLDSERLISVRVETTDPRVPPYESAPEKYPRVLRIRILQAKVPQLLTEIHDFNLAVFYPELTRDGRSLLIEGLSGPKLEPVRLVKAFDIAGNRELWTIQETHPKIKTASFHFDPSGQIYMRLDPAHRRVDLLAFPSRELLETYEKDDARSAMCSLSPGGQLRLSAGGSHGYGIHLWALRQELLMVAADALFGGFASQFSVDGRFAVWGNRDGTVTVFEPKEVQDRLARFGLGW